MKIVNKYFALPLLALSLFTACEDVDPAAGGDTTNQRDFTIADYIVAGNNTQVGAFNTLFDALEKADMLDALTDGEFTLLAPTDAAFAAAGINVATLSAVELETILNYHLIPSELATLPEGRTVTVNGKTIHVKGTTVNGSATATKHITLQNGVVFSLNQVLLPYAGTLADVIAENDDLSLVLSAINKAGISLTGASFNTLFLPTNEAMEDFGLDQAGIDATDAADLEDLLNYHILSGDLFGVNLTSTRYATLAGSLVDYPGVTIAVGDPIEINGIEVVGANNIASNGVVHIIDGFLEAPVTMIDGFEGAVYGGNTGVILSGLYAGILRVGLEDLYFADLTDTYSVIGPCCGIFNEANYPIDADLIDAIEAHIFEGNVNWITLASVGGTRFESVNGNKYVATSSANGRFINGNWGNAFGATSTGGTGVTYNGTFSNAASYQITMGNVPLTGLPEESITDILDEDVDFNLFSAALRVLGVTSTGDYTVLAINNVLFEDIFEYSTVEEVEAADADEFEVLLNHVISKWYFSIDLDDGSLPALVAASGETLQFSYGTEGEVGILLDSSDLSSFVEVINFDLTAANGVVHEVDDLIEF